MKLFHAIVQLAAAAGGPPASLASLARRPVRHGHKVEVLACRCMPGPALMQPSLDGDLLVQEPVTAAKPVPPDRATREAVFDRAERPIGFSEKSSEIALATGTRDKRPHETPGDEPLRRKIQADAPPMNQLASRIKAMASGPANPAKSSFLSAFPVLFLVICQNLVLIEAVRAASSFVDGFDDVTHISQTARVSIDTAGGRVTLQSGANSLADSDTLLLTHLGSDSDITTPAIAAGGGDTPTGVTYTTGNGGYSGEAAIISGAGSNIAFPVSGNFNPLKGTIDFWLSFSDWSLFNGHTPDYPNEEMILYALDGGRSLALFRNWNGNVQLRFVDANGGLYSRSLNASGFVAGSWHHFTFTWNIEEDVFYIDWGIDGAFTDRSELADSVPNTWNVAGFASFHPTTLYVGNRSDGLRPLNGRIDELRITGTEYALTNYPGKSGVLTSTAFDTGVASPAWGKIKWDETLPSKTDIELQTSTSDDGLTWTNWFAADKGMVTITFDDGYTSVFDNAYPVMRSLGFRGVSYIITSLIGSNDALYLNLAETQALQAAGWEIGAHGSIHVSTAQSLADGKNWLLNHGFAGSACSYPGGFFDQALINSIADYYTTARTTRPQYQSYDAKYQLYGYPSNGPNPVPDVNSFVDSVANRKAWGILVFHSVGQPGTPAGPQTDLSVADFAAMLQHISVVGLDVVTVAEALDGLAMYTNNGGDQIRSPNKRYIKYRAICHSYNGMDSPVLSSVTISAPTKLYKGIATTINADGTYDHATWPQTTDTAIDNLTVTPNTGSVTVTVDAASTWDADHGKWRMSCSNSSIATVHSVSGLREGQSDQVRVNGSVSEVLQADSSGRISFTYSGGGSDEEFEVHRLGPAADFDADGDVDLSDFGHLQACLTGDGVPLVDPACGDADFDADGDVDLVDVQRFRQCLRGPGILAPVGCLDVVP